LTSVTLPATYRCSLGTNTVLGLVTDGLFGEPPEDDPVNSSVIPPLGNPKMVPPDCPFDMLSASLR
jgi:hypothetical protein